MRAKHTALILTAGFLLIPALSSGQFPGQGGGGGQGGGMRGFSMDPDQLFNFAAKGKEVIIVDELDGMQKMMFDRMAGRLGLTGREITRDQFKGAMVKAQQMAASGELSGMNFQGGNTGQPAMVQFPQRDSGDRERRRDEYFKRLDRNEDGVLEFDELAGDPIAEGLQTERSKYDSNSDGFIDPSEFKSYLSARFPSPEGGVGGPGGEKPGLGGPDAPKEEERKRPTIIRAGNLPSDFPFTALDTDTDGQVGLYEWKNGGKKIGEFLPLDLNNDGFLTVDEYYRSRKLASGGSAASDFARGRPGMNGDPRMMAANGFNGQGGGMRGFGGGGGEGDRRGFGGGQGGAMGMTPVGGGFGGGQGGDRRGFGGGQGGAMGMTPVGGGFGGGQGGDRRGFGGGQGGAMGMTPAGGGFGGGQGGDRRGFGGGQGGGQGGAMGMTPAGGGFGGGQGGDRRGFGGGQGGGMTPQAGGFGGGGGGRPGSDGAAMPPGGGRGERGGGRGGESGGPPRERKR